MAFSGIPVVKKVSAGLYRITGVALDDGASGTIGLQAHDGSGPGEINLACPEWQPEGHVTLQDAIEVTTHFVEPPAASVVVEKTGSSHDTFLATISNVNGGEMKSGPLEIYLRFFL